MSFFGDSVSVATAAGEHISKTAGEHISKLYKHHRNQEAELNYLRESFEKQQSQIEKLIQNITTIIQKDKEYKQTIEKQEEIYTAQRREIYYLKLEVKELQLQVTTPESCEELLKQNIGLCIGILIGFLLWKRKIII